MNPRPAGPEVAKELEVVENGGYTSEAVNPAGEIGEHEAPTRSDLMLAVWRERRFIAKAFVMGFLAAAIISLMITPQYESTTRILPPDKRGMNGLAAMLAASGSGDDKTSSLVGGFVSDAIGIKSTGALQVGFLRSATVEDAIINQFDLRKVYRMRYQKDARNVLAERTDINEDRKSGIISITVTDPSPERATAIARAYTDQLGILTAQLDTSAAHKERVFLETRLKQVKEDLDDASKALSEFSSKNVTLDVKEQGKAMVQGAATLEGELIATESQLSGLEQIYTENNVRVRTLQARADQLKRKLAELRGSSDGPDTTGEFGVSIAKLPVLGLTYYDLFRRAKIQEAVFETLTKQFELAKIEEAKSVPTIKVLDPAQVPEQKSSPKRTLITLCGALFAALMALCYVILSLHWRAMSPSHPMSLFGLEVRDGLARDLELLRKRTGPLLKAASKLRLRSKESKQTDDEYPQS